MFDFYKFLYTYYATSRGLGTFMCKNINCPRDLRIVPQTFNVTLCGVYTT